MMKKFGWDSNGMKMEAAKNCMGKQMFTEKCREAIYDWLDDKNAMEWWLTLSYWWYGIPAISFFGVFQWFMMPLKMLLFLVAPDAKPSKDIDYS